MDARPAFEITMHLNFQVRLFWIGLAVGCIAALYSIAILDPERDLAGSLVGATILAVPFAVFSYSTQRYRIELNEATLTRYGHLWQRRRTLPVDGVRRVYVDPMTWWHWDLLVFESHESQVRLSTGGRGPNLWLPNDVSKILLVLSTRNVAIDDAAWREFAETEPGAPPKPISWWDVALMPLACAAGLALAMVEDRDWWAAAATVGVTALCVVVAGRIVVGRGWTPPPGAIPE